MELIIGAYIAIGMVLVIVLTIEAQKDGLDTIKRKLLYLFQFITTPFLWPIYLLINTLR